MGARLIAKAEPNASKLMLECIEEEADKVKRGITSHGEFVTVLAGALMIIATMIRQHKLSDGGIDTETFARGYEGFAQELHQWWNMQK